MSKNTFDVDFFFARNLVGSEVGQLVLRLAQQVLLKQKKHMSWVRTLSRHRSPQMEKNIAAFRVVEMPGSIYTNLWLFGQFVVAELVG